MLTSSAEIMRSIEPKLLAMWRSILSRELKEGVISQEEYEHLVKRGPKPDGITAQHFNPPNKNWRAESEKEALKNLGDCYQSEINFEEKTLEKFNVNNENKFILDRIMKYTFPGRGIILTGNPGVGKTHLMCVLVKRIKVDLLSDVLFYRAHELLKQINMANFLESENLIDRVAGVNVLVIDDLGSSRFSDLDDAALQRILEIRADFNRPTFITNNVHFDDLSLSVSPRLLSRLLGAADLLTLVGIDRRTYAK